MKRILAIFPVLLLCWSSYAQNIESITLRIDQVLNLKTNELSGGDGSYISYSKGSAKVRFYPETKIIDRTALDRNYIEREGSVSDFMVDRKGRYKFRINIEDNHNTQDFNTLRQSLTLTTASACQWQSHSGPDHVRHHRNSCLQHTVLPGHKYQMETMR